MTLYEKLIYDSNKFDEEPLKLNNKTIFFEDKNTQSTIFDTHFFTSSWLNLNTNNKSRFILLYEKLYNKDIEHDKDITIGVPLIFIRNNFSKKCYVISVENFTNLLSVNDDNNCLPFCDIFIPRSIWLKGYLALNENFLLQNNIIDKKQLNKYKK